MNTKTKNLNLLLLLIVWYLGDVPKKIFEAWGNFLRFGLYYFSIPFLLKTLFAHWHKYFWQYPKTIDIGKILEVWASNQISRLIGMIARIFLISLGLIFEFLVLIVGALLLIGWFLLPFLLFFLFIYGFKLLFNI